MNVGQSRGAPAPAVTPALLLLLAAGGRAQPAPAQTAPALGFADLEPMALEHNPTLGQAEAAVRAAEGRRLQAGLYPNPIVGYQGEELSTRAFS
jgi:outer membrane protein, heavy metal efflux system